MRCRHLLFPGVIQIRERIRRIVSQHLCYQAAFKLAKCDQGIVLELALVAMYIPRV